jgi:hypothetical protein
MAHYSLLRVDLAERLLPIGCGLLVAVLVTLASARYVLRVVPRRRPVFAEQGTTELEFALALPIFLVSVLVTVQVAMMVNANLVVDYAAFAAARSAAVWIPRDTGEEPRNAVAPARRSGMSGKWRHIRAAGTMACMPISPRISSFRFGFATSPGAMDLSGDALAQLAAKAEVQPDTGVNWLRLGADAVNKWVYAVNYTQVELVDDDGNARTTFESNGPVTVRVTHDFEMAVPYAGPLLGSMFGDRYLGWFGGYYVPISAQYTLMVWPA